MPRNCNSLTLDKFDWRIVADTSAYRPRFTYITYIYIYRHVPIIYHDISILMGVQTDLWDVSGDSVERCPFQRLLIWWKEMSLMVKPVGGKRWHYVYAFIDLLFTSKEINRCFGKLPRRSIKTIKKQQIKLKHLWSISAGS